MLPTLDICLRKYKGWNLTK